MPLIKKIAIANRGEIAKRILITCQELGLKSVLLYASGDTHNEAFRLCEEKICIGPADPLKSYLNIEEIINASIGAGADAIHPGYGFLSENPNFAEKCLNKGLIFIGPDIESLKIFGNKNSAKKKAEALSIPTLPTCSGNIYQEEKLMMDKAEKIGWPLMIKSTYGGGGRGLRVAYNKTELKNQLPMVCSEVLQSFNSEDLFLEKYLDSAKHIEVQFFISADKEVWILGDRDCSSQRRHQKIIEEAPAQINKKIKEQMRLACLALLSDSEYRGAGTIEFLVQEDKFYFLEINPRLQVEHTVTEMIYGIDLVKAQILTAQGQPAFLESKSLQARGHSIQCRICAEDPNKNFLPSSGSLLSTLWPQGPFIRVDTAYHTGDQIPVFYDSLITKLIVWDNSRVRAIEKMKRALEKTILFGVFSNINFLNFILSHPLFIENQMTTKTVEQILSREWKPSPFPIPEKMMTDIYQQLDSSPQSLFNPWTDFLKGQK